MSLTSKQSLCLIYLLMFQSLFASILSANWQGTGNLTSSNLTSIWDFIDGNQRLPRNNVLSDDGNFCQEFSNHLNNLWDPAWNVVLTQIYGSTQFDTVLYGYAFRGHWMWYNNHIINGFSFSFIIWKDYNCQTWAAAAYNRVGFNDQQQAQIKSVRDQFTQAHLADIWGTGKKFIDDLLTKSLFVDTGLSIVISQSTHTNFFSYFCSVQDKYEIKRMSDYYWNGKYLLLQTRQ